MKTEDAYDDFVKEKKMLAKESFSQNLWLFKQMSGWLERKLK